MVIMLGMGITLTLADFKEILKAPRLIFTGVVLQFLIMPAWSAFLGWGMSLPREMAVGLILVACCPGGTASNVIVFLARANVALSVSLTLFSTLLAIGFTPWLTFLYAGHYVPVDPWGLFKSLIFVVFLPLALGILWNHFLPRFAKQVSIFSPLVSVFFILLIVGFVLAAKRDLILAHGWILLSATGMLHLGGFAGGYILSKLIKVAPKDCQTISIEVGMQNSGLGTALATKHFSSMPMVPAPCALSAILHCLLGSFLAALWSRKNGGK